MRIDVVNLLGTQVRFLQGAAHGSYQAFTFRRRLGHVIGIAGRSITYHFCENMRSTRLREFQVFQDQHAGAFAHHKAVASGVERTAGSLRVVIASRERVHIIESGHGYRCNASFRPARDHGFGIATANGFPGFAYRIGASREGGYSSPVRPFRARHNGDKPRRSIDDHHIDEEWADAVRSSIKKDFELVMQRDQPANATADVHADVVGILFGDLQARLGKRLLRGCDSDMLIGVAAAIVSTVHIEGWIKVLDLRTEMNTKLARIIYGDLGHAGFALAKRFPARSQVVSNRGD